MTRVAKVAATLLALVLIGAWVWYSDFGAEASLDYPLRRAGESAEYPARGTFVFYWKCLSEIATVFAFLLTFGAVPLLIALSALFYGCSIRSWATRSAIILIVLLMPLAVSAGYRILSR
jgi:hypothetical protein